MTITFTQTRTPAHQISVADEQERYYVNADAWTAQEVADAFLSGYGVPADDNGSTPVRFCIEYVEGSDIGSGVLACFVGLPNGTATQTA